MTDFVLLNVKEDIGLGDAGAQHDCAGGFAVIQNPLWFLCYIVHIYCYIVLFTLKGPDCPAFQSAFEG